MKWGECVFAKMKGYLLTGRSSSPFIVVALAAIGGLLARLWWKRRANRRALERNKAGVLPIDSGGQDVLAYALPAGTKGRTTMANVASGNRAMLYNNSILPRIFDEAPAYSSTDNLSPLRQHMFLSTAPSETTNGTMATIGHGHGLDALYDPLSEDEKEKELEAGYPRLTVGDFVDDSASSLSPVSSRQSKDGFHLSNH